MRNLRGIIVCFILLVFSFPLMAQTEPTLVIPVQVPADAGGTVTVPVTYTANGNAISTMIFSVDIDETNLDFDPASTTGFPWPDAITVNPMINPFVFSVGITYDANDTDGELDFAFADINPPLTALPEGELITITFTAGDPAVTTEAPVVFSQDPPVSFGNTDGESVPGITSDGSVLITVVCTPTGMSETICNGIDDDCDDSIDEDFTPEATTCGVGECAATGQTSCVDGVGGDSCTPGAPTAEVCDNLDNDCDGSTDENLKRLTTCGVGECGATGDETCSAGAWVNDTCTPGTPSAEVCEGTLDENCDGVVDEGCDCTDGETRSCGSDAGECTAGTETCAGGLWNGTCVDEVEPSAEVCDNLDNDCDGSTDEDLTRPTTCGAGECAGNTGEETCTAGTWDGDTCDPFAGAVPEGPSGDGTCGDTLDNDCDGLTDLADPGCEIVCTPTGVSETVCNGVDDDCDAVIDEDYRSMPTSCGAGECASTGQTTCVEGVEGDTCTPGTPTEEVCDDLDNDCDGSTDENLTRPTTCGMGECAGNTGEETCTAGTWGGDTCDPLAGAAPDDTTCNEIDDDCDGQVDEDFQTTASTCGVGACDGSTGQIECQEGSEVDTCDPLAGAQPEGPPGDGTCSDTVDNDCDGQTDLGDIDCQANLELFDWGFYVDGITYCLLGPCDFDVDDIGNISGPEDLPSFIDISDFDFTAGLGSISITLSDPGNHSVVMFVDHDIDIALNDFINETGIANGSPEMGQTWELDEPGGNFSEQNGSEGFPYFGDIFFDNFLDGLLDNRAFYDAIDDQTLTPPDDVSMAMGWDFELVEGQTATTVFLLSNTSIPQGFHLLHRDPDSDVNIYFSSSLDRAQDVETDCFDGVDNDGDGLTDCADPDCEGATDGSCDTGQPGICSTGITTCQSEASVCVPEKEAEPDDSTCNNEDDDCDGQVDEDFQTTPTICGVGACEGNTGQAECQEGSEVDTCNPLAGAAADDSTCNNEDDDCDGQVDEDFQTTPTICGVGACEGNTGQVECQEGSEVDTCNPLAGAAADDSTCNNEDDDCDGQVDEDFQTTPTICGVGACEGNTGQVECQEGSEVDTCNPLAGAAADDSTCNNEDDDCDGQVDEDFQTTPTICGVGACEGNTGKVECQEGTEVDTCDPLAGAVPEGSAGDGTCSDMTDNDCDGTTDMDDDDCVSEEPEMINNRLTLVPIWSTAEVTTDAEGCPTGFVGIYSVDANLMNKSDDSLSTIIIEAAEITGGNLLQNADGGPGGEGAMLTVPLTGSYSDGELASGESVEVPFKICLKEWRRFALFMDVFGVVD